MNENSKEKEGNKPSKVKKVLKFLVLAVPSALAACLYLKNKKLEAVIKTQQDFIESTGKQYNEALYQLGKAKQQLDNKFN